MGGDIEATEPSSAQYRTSALKRAGRTGVRARLIVMAVGVLAQPILVRSMGNDSYGAFATITTVAALASFSDLGIGNGIITRVAILNREGRRDEVREVVSTATALVGLVGVCISAVGLALGYVGLWGRLLNSQVPHSEVNIAISAYIALFGITVPLTLSQKLLLAEQRVHIANTGTWIATIVGVATSAVAAVFQFPLYVPVVCIAIPAMLLGVAQWIIVVRGNSAYAPNPRMISVGEIWPILSLGALFLAIAAASSIAYQTDLVVVSTINGTADAAILAVAIRFYGSILQIAQASMNQLWPAFADALANNESGWVRATFLRATCRSTLAAIACCSALSVALPSLVRLLFGPDVVPPLSLIVALAVWTTYQIVIYPGIMLLNAFSVIRSQALLGILMSVLSLVVSVILTKSVGISGPAWAHVISHCLIVGLPLAIILARRIHSFR